MSLKKCIVLFSLVFSFVHLCAMELCTEKPLKPSSVNSKSDFYYKKRRQYIELLLSNRELNAKNDARACVELAVGYYLGRGVERDEEMAKNYARRALPNAKKIEELKEMYILAKVLLGEVAIGLHNAAGLGFFHLCEFLLDCGADINGADEKKATPLHHAAANDHIEVISLLLSRGALAEVSDCKGLTPLHEAARFGTACSIELLILRGANVMAKDIKGVTPLYYAFEREKSRLIGRESVFRENIEMLLERGADPTVEINRKMSWHEGTLLALEFESPLNFFRIVASRAFFIPPRENQAWATESPSDTPFLRIISLLWCLGRLGLNKDLCHYFLLVAPAVREDLFAAIERRIQKGISVNRVREYMQATPLFIQPHVFEIISERMLESFKEVSMFIGGYRLGKTVAFFKDEAFADMCSHLLKENVKSRLGFA